MRNLPYTFHHIGGGGNDKDRHGTERGQHGISVIIDREPIVNG